MKSFQFIVFIIFQLTLLPITLLGYAYTTFYTIYYSNKFGLSATTITPLSARYALHIFGIRDDENTKQLTAKLPNFSMAGFWMVMSPAILANRCCGYTPKVARLHKPENATISSFFSSRTGDIDRRIEKHLDKIEQVVLMGAGFDTRALKLCINKKIQVFELDQKNTQNCKLEALKKAKIDYHSIKYVPVDFHQESWVEKLIEQGFNTSKRTFFLWEGVTIYLEEESIKQTLRNIVNSCAKDSVVVFDFYSNSFVTGEYSSVLKYYVKALIKITNENFLYGVDTSTNPKEEIEKLLHSTGLSLEELVMMGKTTENSKPFGGLVEARI